MSRRLVADVPIAGPVPRDVDTWEDYRAVLDAPSADHPAGRATGTSARI